MLARWIIAVPIAKAEMFDQKVQTTFPSYTSIGLGFWALDVVSQ